MFLEIVPEGWRACLGWLRSRLQHFDLAEDQREAVVVDLPFPCPRGEFVDVHLDEREHLHCSW